MAAENLYLLVFAAVLLCLHALLGGPLASAIAGFFARLSRGGPTTRGPGSDRRGHGNADLPSQRRLPAA